MAKGSAPVSRLSKDYNPNTLKKELDKLSRAVNRVSAKNEDLDNRISREILSVRKSVDVAAQFSDLVYWTEWYEELDGGTLYAVAKLAFRSGWGAVADVQYRYGDFGNIPEGDTWSGLETPGTLITWVEDPGTEAQNYPQGGYYRFRKPVDKATSRERKTSFQVQLRAVNVAGSLLLQESNTYDIDKLPDVMSMALRLGTYDGTQWSVFAKGQCDLDSLSVGLKVRSSIGTVDAIAASATPYTSITFTTLSYNLYNNDIISIGGYSFYSTGTYSAGTSVTVGVDDGAGSGVTVSSDIDAGTAAYADWTSDESQLSPSGFNDYSANLTASNKNFDVFIGKYDPGVPVFAIAAAFGEASLSGDFTDKLLQRASITTPEPGFDAATSIGTGDITANMLAVAAQRANISIQFAHKGFTSTDEDFLTYSGSIVWADATTYNVSSTSFPTSEPTAGVWYIFHDPDDTTDNNATYNTVTNAETQLQLTDVLADAASPVGRRILVGLYSPGDEDGEAAFFVSNTSVAISAPFIYAAKLEALTGKMGTLFAGAANFKIGDEVSPDGIGGYNDGIFLNTDNYWYDTGNFKVGDANRSVSWDGSSLAIDIDGSIAIDENGFRILSQSGNVDKIRWVNALGSTLAEIYTGGSSVFTISAGTNSVAVIGSSTKLNKGVALLADITNPASDAPGQAFFTTLYASGGNLYNRGGTGTAYQIVDASNFPITGNNGDILYYDSGWQKLGAGTNGYVLTLASGLPTWAAAGGGGGSTTFVGLTDTPANYTGAAGQYVRVNSGGTGLEFAAISGGGTGDVVGPSSAVSGNVASFDGTTGKLIQDSGIASANINLLDTAQTISGFKTHTNDITMRYASAAASPNTTVDSEPLNFSASFRPLAGSDYSQTESIYLNGTGGEAGTWVFRLGSTFSANDSGETSVGTVTSGTWSATNISLAKGGTGASLLDPNADRILFWDDSASTVTWLAAGDGLAFNGTNLQMDWSAAAASVAPYKVVVKDNDQNIRTFNISVFGASLIDDADAATARTTLGLGSGVTGSFTETEFRNQGGGTGTEFRSRTNTLTNGIVTAQSAWGAWTEVVAIP